MNSAFSLKGHGVSHWHEEPSSLWPTRLPPSRAPSSQEHCLDPSRRLRLGISRQPAGWDRGLFCADSHQDANLPTELDLLLLLKSAQGPLPEGSMCLPAQRAGMCPEAGMLSGSWVRPPGKSPVWGSRVPELSTKLLGYSAARGAGGRAPRAKVLALCLCRPWPSP